MSCAVSRLAFGGTRRSKTAHCLAAGLAALLVAVAAGLAPASPAHGWEVSESKWFGSQSTEYVAARTSSLGVALEFRRMAPDGGDYVAVLEFQRRNPCAHSSGWRIRYRIDGGPETAVDFHIDFLEGQFRLPRPMMRALIAGTTLHVDREPMRNCLPAGSPLRLEYSLAGLARAVADMNGLDFVIDPASIAVDGKRLLWRALERRQGTGLEGTVTLSSERTASGYPMKVEAQSIGGCAGSDGVAGSVALSVDGGTPVELEAVFTVPQPRTHYRGWADYFIEEGTVAALKRGGVLAVSICTDEGDVDLEFDLKDFDRAWSEARSER